MNEENRKEVLTIDIIKKDIRGILIYNIFAHLFFGILFLSLVLAFYGLYLLSDISRQSLNMIFSIISAVVFSPFLFLVIRYIRMLLLLKKECFNITTDKIYDKNINIWLSPKYRTHTQRPVLSFGIFKTDLILYFNNYKKYHLSSGGHYSFSKNNKMQYYQQFNSAEICDEFYLFMIDNKIIEIYNTKFFELQE